MDPAWIALSLLSHIGGKTFRALLAHFDDELAAILAADEATLRQVRGVGPKIAAAIQQIDLDQLHPRLDRWTQAGVRCIPSGSPIYSPLLHQTEDAPPTLFTLGDFNPGRAYAVVGTRRPTPAAARFAEDLGAELARAEVIVVSGLAAGVDSAAHLGALSIPGGRTTAVLGSGILNVYPQQNGMLAQAIVGRAGSALLCEVAPDATVSTPGLVARNRIITGLCEAVVIVETSAEGGAMHAARFARVQGRRLYVLDNAATGNRQLIAGGAVAVGNVAQLLDCL